MAIVELAGGGLSARLSTRGGVVLGLWQDADGAREPLLRPAASDEADARSSACYPLVPFGNRLENNRFSLHGRDYRLEPNTPFDPLYLHGDGWLGEWSVLDRNDGMAEFDYMHDGPGTPYAYEARQRFALRDGSFEMRLQVWNRGPDALPFGLGWHPFFPMTGETLLRAPAQRFWTEVEGFLPGARGDIPADLDFSVPRPLPHRWINNGFEDWDGSADVIWPDRRLRLQLTAGEGLRHYFVFVSDTRFDPNFRRDYVCFEPMSHLANGHNLPGLGDLTILAPGEAISASLVMRPLPLD